MTEVPNVPPYTFLALMALDEGSIPQLQTLARRLPATWWRPAVLPLPTTEAAVAVVREAFVTLFLQDDGPTGPLGVRLIAEARAAGRAAVRIGADGSVPLDDDGQLRLAPGTRLGDTVDAVVQIFGSGLVGLDYINVSRVFNQPGAVTVAIGKGTAEQACTQVLERIGQRGLAAAQHVFLNVEVSQSGTLLEATLVAETVQAALPTGVEVEFGVVVVDEIRDGASRLLLVVAEGRETGAGHTD